MGNQGWPEEGEWPTPEEQQRLYREWRDDIVQRTLRDKEVRYEDEYDRILDNQVEQNRFRQQSHERDRGQER